MYDINISEQGAEAANCNNPWSTNKSFISSYIFFAFLLPWLQELFDIAKYYYSFVTRSNRLRQNGVSTDIQQDWNQELRLAEKRLPRNFPSSFIISILNLLPFFKLRRRFIMNKYIFTENGMIPILSLLITYLYSKKPAVTNAERFLGLVVYWAGSFCSWR